jgi:hypothetical protein
MYFVTYFPCPSLSDCRRARTCYVRLHSAVTGPDPNNFVLTGDVVFEPVATATIGLYLAAVRAWHLAQGWLPLLTDEDQDVLAWHIWGMWNIQAGLQRQPPSPPITFCMLRTLERWLDLQNPFDAAVWAIATCGFWGLMRVGEYDECDLVHSAEDLGDDNFEAAGDCLSVNQHFSDFSLESGSDIGNDISAASDQVGHVQISPEVPPWNLASLLSLHWQEPDLRLFVGSSFTALQNLCLINGQYDYHFSEELQRVICSLLPLKTVALLEGTAYVLRPAKDGPDIIWATFASIAATCIELNFVPRTCSILDLHPGVKILILSMDYNDVFLALGENGCPVRSTGLPSMCIVTHPCHVRLCAALLPDSRRTPDSPHSCCLPW